MSVIFVVIPAVAAGWPAIAAAVGAACASLGYSAAKGVERSAEQALQAMAQRQAYTTIELEMANAEVVGEAMVRGQNLQFEKDGVVATFSKDARGHLSLHVGGERTEQELAEVGQQLMNRVRQQYAYEKVKQELTGRGFVLVDEHVDADENIRISVRRF